MGITASGYVRTCKKGWPSEALNYGPADTTVEPWSENNTLAFRLGPDSVTPIPIADVQDLPGVSISPDTNTCCRPTLACWDYAHDRQEFDDEARQVMDCCYYRYMESCGVRPGKVRTEGEIIVWNRPPSCS